MKQENIIEVKHIAKVFSRNYKSARVQLLSILKESFLGCHSRSTLHKDEFWALKDLSFSVKKNEKLAILGPNGSGKSTLLKMLNGIYLPDQGSIQIKGNISSVLELSSGFKPELSGLENIYLKFALLGKKKEEVDAIVDEVIAFSELEEFMETPLKHYSSGMKSKLGFAIVTNMDPEIMILDEVFAAGDKRFQKKSEARLRELYENTTTILVSHSMHVVREVADRVIVLKKGELVFDGSPDNGIEFYENMDTAPTDSKNTILKTFLNRLYEKILERDADTDGYTYWLESLIAHDLTAIDLARAFMTSAEFQNNNVDSKTFVTILYTALIDRKPSKNELDSYITMLNEGLEREKLVETFIYSEKFLNYCKSEGIPIPSDKL